MTTRAFGAVEPPRGWCSRPWSDLARGKVESTTATVRVIENIPVVNDAVEESFDSNVEALRHLVPEIMNFNWLAEYEYTMPSRATYPWMWLWDSCFHAIIYATLGDERALLEAQSIFRWQASDGMVPHMGYQADERFGGAAWRGVGASILTQPPMYGHMLRVLHDQGFDIDPLIESATAGLRFILRERRVESGLVAVVHPWETGADNSPRWNPWSAHGTGHFEWRKAKDRLVTSVRVSEAGSATSNPLFSVAPASFNALVAFNAQELGGLSNDSSLRGDALELAEILDDRFDNHLGTWVDTAPDGECVSSIRTLDALLPILVSPRQDLVERALRLTVDPAAFGASFGPCGVDRREPEFDANAYWRGGAWPQLTYLFYVAATRSQHFDVRESLANSAIRAAIRSNFAEYLNPITGVGLGAPFQSWGCLPIAMLATN